MTLTHIAITIALLFILTMSQKVFDRETTGQQTQIGYIAPSPW